MRHSRIFCLAAWAGSFTQGAINPSNLVTVKLALRHDPRLIAELQELTYAIADTKSELYGKHLSSDEIRPFVAASESSVTAATAWVGAELTASCFNNIPDSAQNVVTAVVGHGDYLEVSGVPEPCAQKLKSSYMESEKAGNSICDVVETVFVKRGLSVAATPPQNRASADKSAKAWRLSHASQVFEAAMASGAAAPPTMDSAGSPPQQKDAYGVPVDVVGLGQDTLQLVWGPGTFGYLPSDLTEFYSDFNVTNANIDDVSAYGNLGEVGGDNFYEGTLDVTYISSMGAGADTVVANTNSSESTEETTGFGYALLEFAQMLATAGSSSDDDNSSLPFLPSVVSMSLGSLSFDSCDLLCSTLVQEFDYTAQECEDYMATQRQVCMYDSASVVERTNVEFLKSAARGVTLLGATGDGGSHFSFGAFPQTDDIGVDLNDISCRFALPTFPAESPFVVGVGGEQWDGGGTPQDPVYWYAGGAGFSRRFRRPRYQDSAVQAYLTGGAPLPPADSFQAEMRAYPDVVALAWGVPMIADGKLLVTGGTSASAPSFAGLVTLLNALRLQQGLPVLGFLQPRLYAAAAAARKSAGNHTGFAASPMFYDITVGNSSVGGDGYQCPSGFVAWPNGWDAATGWGSPRWDGLVEALAYDN